MADVTPIIVIDLWPAEAECFVCEKVTGLRFGVPRYEDLIVPDNYVGEWGGAAVCHLCYRVVRSMQAEQPGRLLPVDEVRKELRTDG